MRAILDGFGSAFKRTRLRGRERAFGISSLYQQAAHDSSEGMVDLNDRLDSSLDRLDADRGL
jgi:hypothetical protein